MTGSQATTPRYCANCGTPIPPESNFCPSCGREVVRAQRVAVTTGVEPDGSSRGLRVLDHGHVDAVDEEGELTPQRTDHEHVRLAA